MVIHYRKDLQTMFRALFQPEIDGECASRVVKTFAKMLHNLILSVSLFLSLGLLGTGIALSSDIQLAWLIGLCVSVLTFLFGLAVSRVVLSFLFAYGEITDRLIAIDTKLSDKQTSSKGDKLHNKPRKNMNPISEYTVAQRTSPWECPFCGYKNSCSDTFCKSCGTEYVNPYMDSSES